MGSGDYAGRSFTIYQSSGICLVQMVSKFCRLVSWNTPYLYPKAKACEAVIFRLTTVEIRSGEAASTHVQRISLFLSITRSWKDPCPLSCSAGNPDMSLCMLRRITVLFLQTPSAKFTTKTNPPSVSFQPSKHWKRTTPFPKPTPFSS